VVRYVGIGCFICDGIARLERLLPIHGKAQLQSGGGEVSDQNGKCGLCNGEKYNPDQINKRCPKCDGTGLYREVAQAAMSDPLASAVAERITEYLSKGGLFNPEQMDPIRVRDLLIDCRNVLTKLAAPPAEDVEALARELAELLCGKVLHIKTGEMKVDQHNVETAKKWLIAHDARISQKERERAAEIAMRHEECSEFAHQGRYDCAAAIAKEIAAHESVPVQPENPKEGQEQ
jgi:hypothetical protein